MEFWADIEKIFWTTVAKKLQPNQTKYLINISYICQISWIKTFATLTKKPKPQTNQSKNLNIHMHYRQITMFICGDL